MADKENHQRRVAAVVAAYNEAERIGAVLEVLTTYQGLDEIIVVDDGSSDHTARVAQRFPVRLVRHPRNMGKGSAMNDGVRAASAQIIFFCDADVIGLTHKVIEETIAPVSSGSCDMMIAMRNRKIYFLRIVLAIIPLLGGERALTRNLWDSVPARYKHNFMIEAALNFYARHYGSGFRYKAFPGLTQTIKERKYGLLNGFQGRVRMFAEVVASQIQLQLTALPPHVQSGRIALMNVVASAAGAALGGTIMLLAYRGPEAFAMPETLISFAAHLAIRFGTKALAVLGSGIVIFNVLFIILNLKNLRFLFARPAKVGHAP